MRKSDTFTYDRVGGMLDDPPKATALSKETEEIAIREFGTLFPTKQAIPHSGRCSSISMFFICGEPDGFLVDETGGIEAILEVKSNEKESLKNSHQINCYMAIFGVDVAYIILKDYPKRKPQPIARDDNILYKIASGFYFGYAPTLANQGKFKKLNNEQRIRINPLIKSQTGIGN